MSKQLKSWQETEIRLQKGRDYICSQGGSREASLIYYTDDQARNNRRYDGIMRHRQGRHTIAGIK